MEECCLGAGTFQQGGFRPMGASCSRGKGDCLGSTWDGADLYAQCWSSTGNTTGGICRQNPAPTWPGSPTAPVRLEGIGRLEAKPEQSVDRQSKQPSPCLRHGVDARVPQKEADPGPSRPTPLVQVVRHRLRHRRQALLHGAVRVGQQPPDQGWSGRGRRIRWDVWDDATRVPFQGLHQGPCPETRENVQLDRFEAAWVPVRPEPQFQVQMQGGLWVPVLQKTDLPRRYKVVRGELRRLQAHPDLRPVPKARVRRAEKQGQPERVPGVQRRRCQVHHSKPGHVQGHARVVHALGVPSGPNQRLRQGSGLPTERRRVLPELDARELRQGKANAAFGRPSARPPPS